MKIHIISLGCPKNLVDSESIAGILSAAGHTLSAGPENSDVIVINTCAFIDEAVKESEKVIRASVKYGKKIIVCGCLPQIKGEELKKKFPDVSAFLGTGEYHRIDNILARDSLQKAHYIPAWHTEKPVFIQSAGTPRLVSTGKGYAYLKISEGCDNRCSYCLIPRIRGGYRSRPAYDIIKEAEKLAGSGIKELILIGQDTTAHPELEIILKKLSKIAGIEWIRLLYAHPLHFNERIIDAIASSEKICRYIDLPLQHTMDEVLKKMGRPAAGLTLRLIERLRKKMPDIAIRSTVMVGFPGETERIFSMMLKDVREMGFDWLGCFEYSPQDGTAAARMPHHVMAKEKRDRYDKVMRLQQEITRKKNEGRIGLTFKVLADSQNSGHAEFQCPEIDGKFMLRNADPGTLYAVKPLKVINIYDLR